MIDIEKTVNKHLDDCQNFLCELLKFPSTSGQEHQAMEFIAAEFEKIGLDVEKVPLSNSLRNDPDYAGPIEDIEYDGRFNIRVKLTGNKNGKKVLLNSHVDVVPPSVGMVGPYEPTMKDDTIFARGACDAKGQVAAIYLIMKALKDQQAELNNSVEAHIVVEEENGGNGSLAMVRNHNPQADACIVLEPSDDKILTSIRGAVWFRIEFKGIAGHSGTVANTKSALLLAHDAMTCLINYHKELLQSSKGLALFDDYPNPMPLTFGKLEAGNWPASPPNKAVLEGVLGFLPNKTKEDICNEMLACLKDNINGEFELRFTYRHDCSVVNQDHELPQRLLGAAKDVKADLKIDAMTASCDAWFYNNILNIPTVVYGPGTLTVAHSKDEQIKMSDIERAAGVIANYIAKLD